MHALVIGQVFGGGVFIVAALRADDVEQGGVHVLAHADRAAHVEMRAALQPVVDRAPVFAQALLHVDFFGLVAREREVEAV